jgi:hypothetical protein
VIIAMGVACFMARARPGFHALTIFENVRGVGPVMIARTEMSALG